MKALAYLNKYLWKYKWSLSAGIIFIFLSGLLKVYTPLIIGDAIDFMKNQLNLLEKDADSISKDSLLYSGLKYAGIYIGLYVLSGVFLFFQRQTIIVVSRKIEYDLKNEIYNHYQELDQNFYRTNNTGDIMNRISEDVSKVRMYLGPAIMYTINLAITAILIIYFMLQVNVPLTFYSLIPLPIMSILIYYISSIMNKRGHAVQKQQSRLSTFVQETFSGIRVLKAYNRVNYSTKNFSGEISSYKTKVLQQVKIDAWFMPTIVVLVGLSTILTIYVGGLKAIDGEISIGDIASFVIYINMLTWPFASLGWVTSLTQRAAASQERINQFLNTKPEIYNSGSYKNDLKGKIEFKDVSFTYSNSGIQALKNISFTIEPGKTLAILGKTGSGKTTIAQIISRLFDVSSGKIFIDDKEITEIDLYHLRNTIGYVPQDIFLFSDTIKNNINFSQDEDSLEKAIKHAKVAGVHENIERFPDKYETLLGERGINLSGGQKQRISIARALVKEPKILILDDSLSAVDTETEDKILNNLIENNADTSTLIISHRISSVQHADEIIVLDQGEIVERGTHLSLIEINGLYTDLYKKQLEESEN